MLNSFCLRSCLLFLSLFFSGAVYAQVSLQISGLEGELKKNAAFYIADIDESDYSLSPRFKLQVKNEIRQALMPFGYYHPEISFEERELGEDKFMLLATVNKGEPTFYEKIDFEISGEGIDDPAFDVIYQRLPKKGDQVNHQLYAGIKALLENLAVQRGYFFAKFEIHQLNIAPDLHSAFFRMRFNTGKRYDFGEISYTGSQIEESRLRSLLNFHTGEPYLASKLGKYNHLLSNSNWFSSILVKGNIENITDDALPVEVKLKPAKRNILETGLGYASDAGLRLKFGWNKPWLNEQGHSISSKIYWSEPKTEASAAYKIPLENVSKDYILLPGGYQHVNNEDTQSEEYKVGAERHWVLDSGWHRTLYLRWMWDDFTQGMQSEQTGYFVPGISYSRSETGKEVPPMRGNKYQFSLEGGSEYLLSDANFARIQANAAWVQGFTQNQRGLAALRSGAIGVDDIRQLPPSLRFFAGGANSIRGYDFDAIAPKDSGGYLMGGKYKLTSTLEYQYRVRANWWIAAFLDSGTVWNETPEIYTGAGLGLRWISPVGPLRLDFAYGLDDELGNGGFHFYFALGPEL